MIRVPEMKIPAVAVTDDIIRAAMAPLIRPTEQPGKAPQSTHQPKLSEAELAFVKDVAIMPDSGVVARYTRCKLSGRQGDKAKRALIEMGFVEEVEQLTPRGRSKMIRLTEKGKSFLKSGLPGM